MDRGDEMAGWSAEKKKLLLLIVGSLVLLILWLKPDGAKKAEEGKGNGVNEENGQPDISQPVRVLIKSGNYESLTHTQIEILFVESGKKTAGAVTEPVATGQAVTLSPETVTEPVILEGKRMQVTSMERGDAAPVYGGKLEISKAEDGLVLIQEVDMETYLKGVLPSEMPANYEKEALKAQAVCARTYVYCQMQEGYAYPEFKALMDDSVSFQVYMNQPVHPQTDLAVDETRGEILTQNKMPVTTWYFSTSWGQTTDTDAWLSDPCTYLEPVKVAAVSTDEAVSAFKTEKFSGEAAKETAFQKQMDTPDENDFEYGEAWYRWSARVPVKDNLETLREKLVLMQNEQPEHIEVRKKNGRTSDGIDRFGKVENVKTAERGDGGIVNALEITTDKQTILIRGQYCIRQILALPGMEITKRDETKVTDMQLLPSAFFYVKGGETGEVEELLLSGGGFGHGAGLSQNGANSMAKKGWNYDEILDFFYKDTQISHLQ